MTQPPRASRFARAAAVVSSVALLALYVAYRSGGQTTTPTQSFPGSKIGVVQLPTSTAPATHPATNAASAPPTTTLTISPDEFRAIYSSKSAPIFKPGAFSGSKSAAVFQAADASGILPGGEPAFVATQPATTTAATRPAKGNAP